MRHEHPHPVTFRLLTHDIYPITNTVLAASTPGTSTLHFPSHPQVFYSTLHHHCFTPLWVLNQFLFLTSTAHGRISWTSLIPCQISWVSQMSNLKRPSSCQWMNIAARSLPSREGIESTWTLQMGKWAISPLNTPAFARSVPSGIFWYHLYSGPFP